MKSESKWKTSYYRPVEKGTNRPRIVTILVACEQDLHFRDIVKSTRARGTREETRKHVLARLASLAQIREPARRLPFLSQEPLAFLRNLGDLVKGVTKTLDLFILINYILYTSMPLVNEIPQKKKEVSPKTLRCWLNIPDYFKWLFLKYPT